MISRVPRQIIGFELCRAVNARVVQKIIDDTQAVENYYVDANSVYRSVKYKGKFHQNLRDKSDTHIIESTNADLRHCIAGLARKKRTFYRKQENLQAVLTVFINAYNRFGEAKMEYKEKHKDKSKRIDYLFSVLDFL